MNCWSGEGRAVGRQLLVRLRRGLAGKREKHRAIVRALGLRRREQEVMHADTPQIRGMVAKVSHLVDCEERDC